MSDDDEIQRLTEIERITNGKPSYFPAFCGRMHAAIVAGWKARQLASSPRLGPKTRDMSLTKPRDIIARATSGEQTPAHP